MSHAIETLLPHRAPMRFIDALTDHTDATATATACFDAGHFAVADGVVLESALVECVAQTVAAAQGCRARAKGQAGRPAPGMLVSVTDFHIHLRPHAGKTLHIEVRELRRFGPMLLIAGTVACDGKRIASGELTVYA